MQPVLHDQELYNGITARDRTGLITYVNSDYSHAVMVDMFLGYWLEFTIVRNAIGVLPVIYNRDRRFKKVFKYEEYVFLPDLLDDLMSYIECVGAEKMYKKSKAQIKNDVADFMSKHIFQSWAAASPPKP